MEEQKHTPGPDMLPISRERFHQTVGAMDVHPRVDESSLKGRFFRSIYEDRYRRPQGERFSDSWGIQPTAYFASVAIAKAIGR